MNYLNKTPWPIMAGLLVAIPLSSTAVTASGETLRVIANGKVSYATLADALDDSDTVQLTIDRTQSSAGEVMKNWSDEDLEKIVKADDLHISPFRDDGVTYGTPTWIWCVAVDGGLYVRAYNGTASRWYQAAAKQKAGRIVAAGMTKDVAFELVDASMNDRIDDAYRAKYSGSQYLSPMISPRSRAATVKIVPR